jgi:hypothetical protein
MKNPLFVFMLLFSISSNAQLGWTKEQLVNRKGQYSREGVSQEGIKYITYNNVENYLSESFFFLSSTGQSYIEVFVDKLSNMPSQINMYSKYYTKIGAMEWLDPKTQIHINIHSEYSKLRNENVMVIIHSYRQ